MEYSLLLDFSKLSELVFVRIKLHRPFSITFLYLTDLCIVPSLSLPSSITYLFVFKAFTKTSQHIFSASTIFCWYFLKMNHLCFGNDNVSYTCLFYIVSNLKIHLAATFLKSLLKLLIVWFTWVLEVFVVYF